MVLVESRIRTQALCCSPGRASVSAWIPPWVPSSQGPGALCSPGDVASVMLLCSLWQGFSNQSGFAAWSVCGVVLCALMLKDFRGPPLQRAAPSVCLGGCVCHVDSGFQWDPAVRDARHWPQPCWCGSLACVCLGGRLPPVRPPHLLIHALRRHAWWL